MSKSHHDNQYPLSLGLGSSDSYRRVLWARFSWQGLVSVKNLTKQVARRISSTSELLFPILSFQQWAPTMENIMHDPSESKNGVSVTREKQVNFRFLIFYIYLEEILAVLINHFFIMGRGHFRLSGGSICRSLRSFSHSYLYYVNDEWPLFHCS